jgi:hypothetical protein
VPRRRVLVIVLALLLSGLGATVAYSATSSPGKSGKPKASPQQSTDQDNETEDQGVPGGSVTRFHGNTDVSCSLPEGAQALEGNWTHGMYVEAWAGTNDPSKIVSAAHSPCGKPMQAAFHGHFGAGNLPPGLAKKDQNQP